MAELSRKVLLEAGLILDYGTESEAEPRKPTFVTTWEPRRYAQKAHAKDFIRQQVFLRDHGKCAHCRLNCCHLHQAIDFVRMAILEHRLGFDFHFSEFRLAIGLDRCWRFPKALWDAHMVIPKAHGGSDEDLNNFLTLCLLCHRRETNRQFYPKGRT